MDTIRILVIVIASAFIVGEANAQQDTKIMSAFGESLKAEVAGNYSLGISQLKAVYQADNYAINARLGLLSLLSKQYTEAVNYYNKAIKLKPYAIECRFGLVKAFNALESWDQVKEQYEAILKIDNQNTTALYWLGVLLYNRKDYDNAAKNFEKIVNLYPLDYGSTIMLAWTRLYQGKNADAKVLFYQALMLSPNDPSATSGLNKIK